MEVYFIIIIVLFTVAIIGNAVLCCYEKSAKKSESKLIERFFVVKEEIPTRNKIVTSIYYKNEVATSPLINIPKNTPNYYYTSERRDRLFTNSQCSRI